MKNNHSILIAISLTVVLFFSNSYKIKAEDGYDLWLRYKKTENPGLLKNYQSHLKNVVIKSETATFKAIKKELKTALSNLLDSEISFSDLNKNGGNLIVLYAQIQNLFQKILTNQK